MYGLSANPPGIHHRLLVQEMAKYADLVIVVPCGLRPDKLTTNDIPPLYRAAMTDMTFQDIPNVCVDLSDLERSVFTRSWELLQRYEREYPGAELCLAVGGDLIANGRYGESAIHRKWEQGKTLWENANFIVCNRLHTPFDPVDLPPHCQFVHVDLVGSSTDIRDRVFGHKPITGLVMPSVETYIHRYNLYRGMMAATTAKHASLDNPRLLILADAETPRAMAIASQFARFEDAENPNGILVCGGDGMMLQAIRQEWRRRLPFIGMNAGHWGFLMNSFEEITAMDHAFDDLSFVQSPMLYVESVRPDGTTANALAFNDCWTHSQNNGQAAKSEVRVNGRVCLKSVVSDGMLVSTAAGSTSYARAMGAMPLPVGSSQLILVGSNVFSPFGWRPAYLPITDRICIRTLEPEKRPVDAFVDGISFGQTMQLDARTSNIASVEIGFFGAHDLQEKIRAIQFVEQYLQ
jgi:nicotinate (nicotinamide) nucleotide adenylyltransferase